MGNIIISYKIFPKEIISDFSKLQKKIEGCLPGTVSIYGFDEEPVAFGLKVLITNLKFPEEKSGLLDEIEQRIRELKEVSQIQTIMVRRIR